MTSEMRMVSRDPSHFRNGRWFLLAEGLALIALGTTGFVSAAAHPGAAPTGAPVLVLALTPWHSAILFGFGVLALAGTMHRRLAIAVSALAAVVFLCLVVIGAVASAHHAPGPLGFEARDIVLHGVLAAANFAVLYWLVPTPRRPDWVVRQGAGPAPQAEQNTPPDQIADQGSNPPKVPAIEATQHRNPARRKSAMSTPQNIVITGASAGIGRAVARVFGARGDNVALLARGQGGLDGAVKDVQAAGGQALAIPTDVADYRQVDGAATAAEQAFGPVDVWINVAFTSVFAPFQDISAEEYRRVTEVSYLGYVYGTMAALSRMLQLGTIVQVGSALGYRAIPLGSWPIAEPNMRSTDSPNLCGPN